MNAKRWYRFFYVLARPFVGLWFPMKVYGRENIPEGGALVCGNHSSGVDPVLVAFALTRKRPIVPMAKESLLRIPILGRFLKLVGAFPVKRGETDLAAVKHAMKKLREGEYVVVFPEGTRIRSREEGKPKTGAAMLACRTGVPVLPMYIPMKKRIFRLNRIYIAPPMELKPEGKRPTAGDYERMTAELMDRIYDCGDGR